MTVTTIPWPRWAAFCQECELRKTFDRDDDRDRWITRHRFDEGHRVAPGFTSIRKPMTTVPKPRPEPRVIPTHAEAIVTVVNILGIARVISDEWIL
jgi:hypothetical protein